MPSRPRPGRFPVPRFPVSGVRSSCCSYEAQSSVPEASKHSREHCSRFSDQRSHTNPFPDLGATSMFSVDGSQATIFFRDTEDVFLQGATSPFRKTPDSGHSFTQPVRVAEQITPCYVAFQSNATQGPFPNPTSSRWWQTTTRNAPGLQADYTSLHSHFHLPSVR